MAGGLGWILAAMPAAEAWVHREVRREERRLADTLEAEFERYRAVVPSVLPLRGRTGGSPTAGA
jgi:protein-S-isoprenylcysteine O-methyltransferase Ste14